MTLFTKFQQDGQAFEEYNADMLWVYNRCDAATLTDVKLLAYLTFMGIRYDELKETVKGDDTKITAEVMLEVSKTRTSINVFKKLATQKEQSIQVSYTSSGPSNKKGNGSGSGPNPGRGQQQQQQGAKDPLSAILKLEGKEKRWAMIKADI